MKQNLYPERLLLSLDKFVQQMHRQNKADNPKLILKLVTRWTQAQPLLTKKLLQYILQSQGRIRAGTEAIAVEEIVKHRLLKEFKQDKLTLAIRTFLYQKDLKTLLERTKGHITNREQAYLINLQKELGLSNQQCQAIKNQNLVFSDSQHIRQSNRLLAEQQGKYKNVEPNLALTKVANKNLTASSSSLTLNPQPSALTKQTILPGNKRQTVTKSSQKQWTWLWLGISLLLLLFIRGFNWSRSSQLTTTSNLDVQQQKLCIDLGSRQSPRMSLGEKVLTQEYNQLQTLSMISLYQGSAAFARCEFSIAKNKFQKSLALVKNNPEALIYLNNAQAISQDHLKIAVSVPIGSKPEIAWEILRGVAQAQAEINKQGGIRKKLLLVQIVNDNNNPEIVRQVAKQLTADENILAVVGHNDSNSSLAASEIYQEQGLVMISPTSTSTKLSGVGSYILRTIPSVAVLANTLANYAASNSLTKIAVCSDSRDSASSSFVEEFTLRTTKEGGEIAAVKCDFAQGNFDPKPVIDQAIAQNADALLLAPSVNQMGQAVAVAQANRQQLPLLGNHSLYTFKTIQQGKASLLGMVVPSPWLPDVKPNSHFSQTAMKYWGSKVNFRTAMAYDATAAIIQGLHWSDTRSKLRSVLTQANFSVDGATREFYFEHGDRYGPVQLAYIQQSEPNSDQYQFALLKPIDPLPYE